MIHTYKGKFITLAWLIVILLPIAINAQETNINKNFPKLTGRIVDNANLIDAATKSQLNQLLQTHENATGNQIVVTSVNSLGGNDIRSYGYQLGRAWQLGEKDKNNGVLLLIAPNERKAAIEVGYGLEGQLTDAISGNIIQTKLLPAFRQQQFSKGVELATLSIIQALDGEYKVVKRRQHEKPQKKNSRLALLFFIFFIMQFLSGLGRRGRRRGGFFFLPMGMGSSSRGSSGFGGGGFSGGGGSFGGGGASGGW